MVEVPEVDPVEGIERSRISAQEVSWALRGLNRAAAEVDHALARRLSLRTLDHTAMGHLMSAQEPLGPVELGNRLGISTGSATELVDRLEKAGHVERRRDSADRRRVTVHLKPPALDRILGELHPMIESLDHLAEEFTPDEQDAIIRYLRRATTRLLDYASPTEPTSAR